MLTTLDRYLLRSLLVNFLIAISVMISLYVTLDMFVNMDEFTEQGHPLPTVIKNVASYYWPNLFLYYAQLAGVISLFACMATLARLRKLNELTALLASGVSLYRVAAPVVAFGVITAGLLIVDTELLIPAVAHRLSRNHDDADGKRAQEVLFLPDRDGALLSAGRFYSGSPDLLRLLVITRDETGALVRVLEADHATWDPSSPIRPQGRWQLERGRAFTRLREDRGQLGPQDTVEVTYPRYYPSDLSPKEIELRQSEGWIRFLSLRQLRGLRESGLADRAAISHTKHVRITTPIVSMVMLLLGLPFFLDRCPASILNDAGKCMVLCGLCYVSTFVAQSIRPASESALPAWIPIFVFATVAMVLIDRIRT
ncbi:MAG: LptF/LptG family permease [Planctomycetes bacterium]|nr:LptF/LptG family permease [Planctomycetota bacterium]